VIMKFSTETLNVLKNFSTINSSLVVKAGSVIRTVSPVKNILAEYTCTESFERNFALYDLNEFLGGLTLFKDPEFIFDNDSFVTIKNGRSKVKYFFSDPSLITSPSDKQIPMDGENVEFELSEEVLSSLLKAASVYQLKDLSLINEDGKINLVVRNKDNDTSNSFSAKVGETDKEFVFNFKIENIKIIPDVYKVLVSPRNISQFISSKYNLQYWIALEPDSTFGG
jgi:hypothetical protein